MVDEAEDDTSSSTGNTLLETVVALLEHPNEDILLVLCIKGGKKYLGVLNR